MMSITDPVKATLPTASNGIHPKVAWPNAIGMVITIIMVAIQQYAPHYAPGPSLIAAVMVLVNSLVGYAAPKVTADSPKP
jgi:hypothetical protein